MNTLNNEQKKAVNCDEKHIVCIAGAGSGKTHCLIERISRLVSEGVDPSSILVLTFTRAAAFEMRERYIKRNTKKLGCPEFRTFHGFCYHLLSTDYDVRKELGYNTIPVITDESNEKRIRSQAKLQSGIKLSEKKLQSGKSLTPKEKYEYDLYQKTLKRRMVADNVITFNTLCNEVSNLFYTNHECVGKYKDKFTHIFVDEFQDTDPEQWMFVLSFENSDKYVCGDALQAIYGFRNADSSIIKRLSTDNDWRTIKITHNYRSTKDIVAFANDISSFAPDSYRTVMSSDKKGEPVDMIFTDYAKFSRSDIQPEEEEKIIEVLESHEGSLAILARTNSECDAIKSVVSGAGYEYTESNNNSDIPHILESCKSNEYFLDWVSTFLDAFNYAQYVRMSAIESEEGTDSNESALVRFYKEFSKCPQVRYRLETVSQLRNLLTDKDKMPFEKCVDAFQLLGMKDTLVDTEATTPSEIIEYISDVFNEHVDSDIYVGTIHSVKGLEYDNVLLIGVNDSSFKLSSEENMNLYYVGATRARYKLHVCMCKRRSRDI